MGIVAGILFGANGAIQKKAVESTNELLPFTLQMIGLGVIFLVMSVLRIWFDLTEVNMVLDDKGIWRSLGPSFRHTFRSLGRLLGKLRSHHDRSGGHYLQVASSRGHKIRAGLKA